jgi:ML domain
MKFIALVGAVFCSLALDLEATVGNVVVSPDQLNSNAVNNVEADQLADQLVDQLAANGNGANQLTWCGGEKSSTLTFTSAILTPYPVVSGKDLFVKVTGRVHKRITKGATAHIVAKFGPIPVLKTEIDICSEVECPLLSDDLNDQSITIKQNIPNIAPKGRIGITIKVSNGDGSEIACLEGKLDIRRS